MHNLRLALTLARRELRGGLRGFRVFFLCLALGSAAISGVESLSTAFLGGLRDQGQSLLGGDVQVQLTHRPATKEEMQFLTARGTVSEVVTTRAMAYSAQGPERTLVELKTVDGRWPLVGAPVFTPAQKVANVLACEDDGVCGAAAEQALLDRLHLKRGDLMKLGNVTLRLMAVVESEPDRISGGFGINLGPHLLVSSKLLPRSGLVAEGSLVDYAYRLLLKPGVTIESFRRDSRQQMRGEGWRISDRRDAVPNLRRLIEWVSVFLTLVGLTALCVGGAGAGQAVLAFLDRKRADIAILKSMGADGGLVFLTFFSQVMGIALLATLLGAGLGVAVPFLAVWRYGAALPLPPLLGFHAAPILLAVAFGLLTAITFTVPPLSRSRVVPPASLFRDDVEKEVGDPSGRAPLPYLLAAGAAAGAIVVLALWTAPVPRFALEFILGGAAVIGVLRLAAAGLKRGLVLLPRPRSPLVRLAFANLTRPGAATAGIITALGLGLTLLATVTLLGKAVEAQVRSQIPATAPSFFFVDIQKQDAEGFDRLIRSFSTASLYQRTPMIRGRIDSVNGVPSRDLRVAPDVRGYFNGDRGISYAATPPPDTEVTAGKWWPPDYDGPTLISIDQTLADGAGIRLGDTMTLNVLGREIEGRIASFRRVNFRTLRQNFSLVLSPGVIDKAPHAFLATVKVDPRQENAMYMAVTDRFPAVSTVRVRDGLEQLEDYLRKLSEGISVASLLTIVAGLLVLAGAITAGTRARVYDATILKVLGAARPRIALVHAMEFGLLGLITAALALLAGTVAAWTICHFILQIAFLFDPAAALATVAGGAAAVLLFGLVGALAALGSRPARVLRAA
jgi:putative ABC transport system permease protein